MRLLSAQFVITCSGPVLKRPIIRAEDDGTIISIEDTGGNLKEKAITEFYNGIIVPGFVNCHCHLELSWLHNKISSSAGLHGFLRELERKRYNTAGVEEKMARNADQSMYNNGVVLCADICNSSLTFPLKRESPIRYTNLIEVFGIDHNKAQQRIKEALYLAYTAEQNGLKWNLTPHSVYSVPVPLLRLIKEYSLNNTLTSIHFLESEGEVSLIESHSGPLMDVYKNFLPDGLTPLTVKDHISAVLGEITESGHLILVHNTFIEREHIQALKKRENLYFCICPNSNLYIEGKLPPVNLLAEENCNIVIGTDSLSSNYELSILSEIKTLSMNFPSLSLETLIRWSTLNGAVALSGSEWAGSLEQGKRPGLVLIEDADLQNMRLLPESTARRLL